MTKKLLVDGFNVIHKLDKYKKFLSDDMEASINLFIEDLVGLSGTSGEEICVVFDGVSKSSKKVAGVEIIFTDKGKTADTIIERLSYSCGSDNVTVVTADYNEQKVVFRSNVRRMTPRELGEKFRESQEDIKEDKGRQKRVFLEETLPDDVREKLDKMRKGFL